MSKALQELQATKSPAANGVWTCRRTLTTLISRMRLRMSAAISAPSLSRFPAAVGPEITAITVFR